MPLSALPYPN